MAVEAYERWESRSQSGDRISLIYVVHGTDDDLAAKSALAGVVPSSYDGRWILGEPDLERIGPQHWFARVEYGRASLRGPEAMQFAIPGHEYSFDTTGHTARITHSKQVINSYAPPDQTAPDCFGAIGDTEAGIEGATVITPGFAWTERHMLSASTVDSGYKLLVASMTGATNLDVFRGFSPKEVLFLGCRGREWGELWWDLTFQFEAMPNVVGLSIGSGDHTISGITKAGWELLDVLFRDHADDDAKRMVHGKPVAAYVHRVYDQWPFVLLGLPDPDD